MLLRELKSEGVLKSWVGFLASSTSSMANVVADETLTWDTGNWGLSSLVIPSGNVGQHFSWNGLAAGKV